MWHALKMIASVPRFAHQCVIIASRAHAHTNAAFAAFRGDVSANFVNIRGPGA
jgi:hypothetical protein